MLNPWEILRPLNDVTFQETFRCAVVLGYEFFSHGGNTFRILNPAIYEQVELRRASPQDRQARSGIRHRSERIRSVG